jgi:putative transcriptional regulator
LAADPPVVFVGGPVEPSAAICLAEVTGTVTGTGERENWRRVLGGLGTLDLSADEVELAQGVRGLRVFVGYAGWAGGQLEAELEASGWFVVDAQPGDALSARPGQLWGTVLRRQGGWLAALAAFPAEPSVN